MAEVTQLKRYDAPRVNWGKWFLIGIGTLFSVLLLVVPMIYIFVEAFSKGRCRRDAGTTWRTRTCCMPSG